MLELLKSLSDPCRLRLVAILLHSELTVQELMCILKMGQSRVSRHLKILSDAGVLNVKRQGTWSYYRIGNDNTFFNAIRPALEPELETLPERKEDMVALAMILDERRKRSQEFFDRYARQWDELARTLLPVPDYMERLLRQVPKGVCLLEIGIGTGRLLTELSRRAGRVIGVDHAPAMLEEARRRLSDEGMTDIELRLGEMTHLPLPDASVGCVVANMVLHHAAEPGTVLLEIQRVLVPGGVLVLADLARHERESVREQLADQWLGFEEQELLSWFAAAGFVNSRCERIEGTAGQEAVLLVQSEKKSL